MTSIQTIVVDPGTPELAICARWRATAFSLLQASFEEELRSLELFASDQTLGCSAGRQKSMASRSERVFLVTPDDALGIVMRGGDKEDRAAAA